MEPSHVDFTNFFTLNEDVVRDYNYYDRQNEFGAGYNERALFLAYLIHETFKVEERDEVFV